MDKKQVYDKMLDAFERLDFPMVVIGAVSHDGLKVTAFVSRWLPVLESEMTSSECEELSRHLDRACRVLARPFSRMIKDKNSVSSVRRSSDD